LTLILLDRLATNNAKEEEEEFGTNPKESTRMLKNEGIN